MNIGIITGTAQKDKCRMIVDAAEKHVYGNHVHCFAKRWEMDIRKSMLREKEKIQRS